MLIKARPYLSNRALLINLLLEEYFSGKMPYLEARFKALLVLKEAKKNAAA
jgi:hypothetical protein